MVLEVIHMSFRAWLRGLLGEGRMYRTQEQMAEAFGTKQPAVSLWLSGDRRPERDSLDRIAKATGTPLADILEMVQADHDVFALDVTATSEISPGHN